MIGRTWLDFARGYTPQQGFYDNPAFSRAEETLRARAAGELSGIEHNLRRQGMDESAIRRLTMPYLINAQQGFRNLVGQQRDWEEQQRALRRARRRNLLGGILGFASNLVPGIAQYRLASQALGLYSPREAQRVTTVEDAQRKYENEQRGY